MSDGQLFDPDNLEPHHIEAPHLEPPEPPADLHLDSAPPDLPVDQDERNRITHALHETLFVEAGAGSGKTAALVNRIIELVTGEHPVPLRHVAAITFTEKAAGELRDRLRRELEGRRHDAAAEQAAQLTSALDDLDGAAISTLHAFAQRILSEHPVEAGLPPAIEVLDEISSQVAFDRRWSEQLDALLDAPEHRDTVLEAYAAGISERHLRDLAVAFNDNWDLVSTRLPAPPSARGDLAGLVSQGQLLLERRVECHFPDDTMLEPLQRLEAFLDRLERAPDDTDRIALLTQGLGNAQMLPKVGNRGKKSNWDDITSMRAQHKALLEDMEEARNQVVDRVIKQLALVIGAFTVDAAQQRRRQGRLEFHDLLVQARDLLRNEEHGFEVRRALATRYQRLLLDEFQDTDPIQIELATLLAASPETAINNDWSDITTEPGRLFFVGDPKQSIYRFRRADIGLFLDARERFGHPPVRLSTNFRSTGPVIEWVNEVFGQLITHRPGSQPAYEPLAPYRGAPPAGPGVAVIGTTPHAKELRAGPLREREAADVAAVVTAALVEQWPVRDPVTGDWRAPQLGDITILLPARTSLPALERALDDANIAHRAETSSLVWSTREIRDVVMCLRAIDDPTDELALVTALRSAVYGCGDDDLYTYRQVHRGTWNHQAPPPPHLDDHPVVQAMHHLSSLHERRMWLSPSELLERLIRERKVFEHGVARGRPRDVWRRLRFVLDQARAYGDSEGGSLRQFLRWATLQSAEGSRVSETVLPETDDDSVRIMTIHGSKGLQFPITVVSGLTTRPGGGRRGVTAAFPPDGSEAVIRLGSNLETREFEWFTPIDEQMGHDERLRLLYVACTRAQDHLVVSLHRREPPKTTPEEHRRPSADLLATASATATHRDFVRALSADPWSPQPTRTVPAQLPDYPTWLDEREAALSQGSRPRSLSATAIASHGASAIERRDPGLAKRPRDLDLPPWLKGRFGTSIGRAVHAVLQTIDLSTGHNVEAMCRAQAAAEGVADAAPTIEQLVRSALGSATVREAAQSRYWRETYVAAPINGTLIEGYIDLMYEADDGHLVIVDYKTDAVPDAEAREAAADRYRLQAATYALATQRATARGVGRVVLLFLERDQCHTHEVVNLDDAMADVGSVIDSIAAGG